MVDGVSWRVLLEDLETAYRQIAAGEPPRLPAKGASFKDWATALVHAARSPEILDELPFWLARIPAAPGRLPTRKPGGKASPEMAVIAAAGLDTTRTGILLREAPVALHARVQEILIAALVHAVHRWTKSPSILLDVESHGRDEEVAGGLDLSRSVGWFTAIFPLGDQRRFCAMSRRACGLFPTTVSASGF